MSKEQGEARNEVKRRLAIALLSSGETGAETARRVGVNRGTIIRWREQDDFKAALEEAKDDFIAQTTRIIQEAGPLAAKRLVKILESGPPAQQVRAAEVILKYQATLHANDAPLTVVEGGDMNEELFESFKAKMRGIELEPLPHPPGLPGDN